MSLVLLKSFYARINNTPVASSIPDFLSQMKLELAAVIERGEPAPKWFSGVPVAQLHSVVHSINIHGSNTGTSDLRGAEYFELSASEADLVSVSAYAAVFIHLYSAYKAADKEGWELELAEIHQSAVATTVTHLRLTIREKGFFVKSVR